MLTTEKIAAAYFRLNGFLLIPHFTTFIGPHNHVDLVGVRMPRSAEIVDGSPLLTDVDLFRHFKKLCKHDVDKCPIGIVAEVKTNATQDCPKDRHIKYVQEFLGGIRPIPVSVFDVPFQDRPTLTCEGNSIVLSNDYAWDWILERIESMNKVEGLNKSSSWCWSEEFLGEVLTLHAKGYAKRSTDWT